MEQIIHNSEHTFFPRTSPSMALLMAPKDALSWAKTTLQAVKVPVSSNEAIYPPKPARSLPCKSKFTLESLS